MYIHRNRTNLNINSAQRKFTLLFGKEIRALAREWVQRLWENMALAVVLTVSHCVASLWKFLKSSDPWFLINVAVMIIIIQVYLLGVRGVWHWPCSQPPYEVVLLHPIFTEGETETQRGPGTSSHFYIHESQYCKGSSLLWASILKHYFLRLAVREPQIWIHVSTLAKLVYSGSQLSGLQTNNNNPI